MNHIEEKIIQTIDEHRDEIIAFAKDIQSHPEPGFYEERTAAHVEAFLRLLDNLMPSDVSHLRWLIPLTGQHMHADTTHRLQP